LRIASLIQNALDITRLGRVGSVERTPYEVILRDPILRLRHYRSAQGAGKQRPSILLVPPLMLSAEVYDIAPEGSAVASLMKGGIDPWVVDFGAPERQEGGLRRTLADHVLAVSRAVDGVRREVGSDVHLAGYSQGGMFCYQTAAYRRSEGIASLVTFGSPVDVRRKLIPGVPDEVSGGALDVLGRLLAAPLSESAVPAWLSRTVFKLLSPMKEIRNQVEFFTRLQDPETVRRRAGQRRFLASEGWVAWPGPAVRDFVEQFLMQNRLFSGGFVIEGRTLTLADVTCPVLTFIGETDDLARPAGVRAIREAAPRAEVYEVTVPAGHFGLVVGVVAMRETWPTVARWLRWRGRGGRRPARLVAVARGVDDQGGGGSERTAGEIAWRLGWEVVETLGGVFGDGVRTVQGLARNVARQFPRISRLSGVTRDTRIGLGLLLAEQGETDPGGTFFLFGGRAYSYADANRRVDAVVRGLISVGVRQGEHVGIYMRSRPTAVALVAAVNRLGAVAVLLRPDGDLKREVELGEVEHLIADPEHGEKARGVFGRDVLVLGGGGGPRKLPAGLIDMETIDPDQVTVPEWYRPSPGRAEEVAFILFAGQGEDLRANRITNRRWALSALGAASAAAMTSNDTVYCWTPIQHPTGLLVSISSALVGGARLALAHGFSAASFWEDVRRYGASVVFYAGTMCRELVDAPPDPVERSHPVRLFAGSGMPGPLWRRLVKRFGPVSVLEFYASTEGNAILANVSGEKVGSVGRPLPGSAEVAIAACDLATGALLHDASGYCRPVADGEAGMLLARVDRHRGAMEGRLLRSVFEQGDAWYPTGDLFRCDEDGDYWLVDHVADVIRGRSRPLASIPIEDAVWELECVSMAAAYGVRLESVEHEIPVVAVVLRPGTDLDPGALFDCVREGLDRESRPAVVHVVDAIPMTAGYRFLKEPLRAAGLESAAVNHERALWHDPVAKKYRPLDAAALCCLAETLRLRQEKRPRQHTRPEKRKRRSK
jgi:putative long chain acyl-CoA synthase